MIDSGVVEHLRRVMRRARENPVFKEAWRSYDEFIERFRDLNEDMMAVMKEFPEFLRRAI